MHKIIMEGQNCMLAEMQELYLPLHVQHLNDPDVHRFISSRPPFTIDQQHCWLKKHRESGGFSFAILAEDRDATGLIFIGLMDFRCVDYHDCSAYSASVIGNKRYWNRGIAREARLMQLKIGFDHIGLCHVYSKTVSANVRSQRLLESTGYRMIDIRPKARMIDGVPHDELLYYASRMSWLPYWNHYCEGE